MLSRRTAHALSTLCLAAPLLVTMPVSHAMTDWLDPYQTTIAGKTVPCAFQWQTELDRALDNASHAAADPLLRNFRASRYIQGPSNSPNWHVTRLKYEQAATEGDRVAQYFLGLMYLSGKGTAIKPDKAFDWFLLAARQNLPEAQYWLADCYAKGSGTLQSNREAIRWYAKAAENGHAVSQTALGLALLYGVGIEKNEKEAAVWLEKASVAGNARAQFYRFRQLANGLGVPKDPERADHWLMQSAEGGWQKARVIVAARDILRYSEHKDNPEHATRAVVWLGEAAVRNDRKALYLLGTLYYNGTLVDKNNSLAAECFLRAAKAGLPNAQRTVGALYENGIGLPKDPAKAFQWYARAAKSNYPAALLALGNCYLTGTGTPHDLPKGFALIRQAAQAGLPDAQFLLAQCHETGTGTPADPEAANHWYTEAAKNGNQQAKARLETPGGK